MMNKLSFDKYQGTGNDFVIIDNRAQQHLKGDPAENIRRLCDRRFGIGADGLILLEEKVGYDFAMVYYNADGRPSSMCGNGGRCIVAFAHQLGLIGDRCRFWAIDGAHDATVASDGWIALKMGNVPTVAIAEDHYYLNTGSPHYVRWVDDIADVAVVAEGRKVRYSERFKTEGTNVNFVAKTTDGIAVATYERGVEDETLSCGTGVTAAAIVAKLSGTFSGTGALPIMTKGGKLEVQLTQVGDRFEEIWLRGPAEFVFRGEIATV